MKWTASKKYPWTQKSHKVSEKNSWTLKSISKSPMYSFLLNNVSNFISNEACQDIEDFGFTLILSHTLDTNPNFAPAATQAGQSSRY